MLISSPAQAEEATDFTPDGFKTRLPWATLANPAPVCTHKQVVPLLTHTVAVHSGRVVDHFPMLAVERKQNALIPNEIWSAANKSQN